MTLPAAERSVRAPAVGERLAARVEWASWETMMGRVRALVAKEVREAIPPFIFFVVMFHMLGLSKAVLTDEYSFTALRAVGMTVAALIVAKAILVVEALPVAKSSSPSLLVQIVWKTVLFAAMAVVFHVLEEMIPLMSKHHGVASGARAYFAELSLPHVALSGLWLLAGLFLYCTCWELVRMVGPEEFKKRLRGTAEAPGA